MARLVFLLVAFAACSSRKPSVAELRKAGAPVQRQAADSDQPRPAPIGTKFYVGDLVRTTKSTAELGLAGGSRIEMLPATALRFLTRVGITALVIDDGEITLAGTGSYKLDLGTLTLENGTVRIAGGKTPTLQLVLGHGQLEQDGRRAELQVGEVVGLQFGEGSLAAIADAGVPDAPPNDALANDAATSDEILIQVTGDGATMRAPGDSKWTKLVSGPLAPGTRIALDAKTSATVTEHGTTLELAPGSRALVTSSRELQIESGAATARVAADGGQIGVPGGQVKLGANGQATISLDARRNATVTAVIGVVQIVGKRGSRELPQGESGLLRSSGAVAPGELVIPAFYDYEMRIGEAANITIHDPAGATAIRFAFAKACATGGAIELDRDAQFRSPLVSVGDSAAQLMVRGGHWAYRVRCTTNGARGDPVASGRLVVVRDRGTRPLPKDPPRFEIAADGRNYRLDYQTRIPDVYVLAGGSATTFKLHLVSGSDDRVVSSATGSFKISGTVLREREYTFWVERDGAKSKLSTLRIGFDQTTAQVYIESPVDGRPWGPSIEVAGATLPGWSAAIDGKAITADKNTRRFSSLTPAPPEARAISIQLSHPEHGVHVYLRRGAPR